MDGLKTKEDRRFQTFWVIFFILISVIAIIPVLRVISISFSGRDAINKGQVFIFPIGFNVDAYAKALKSGTFVSSFGYSIILMAVVTAVDMIMTILLAYPLSRPNYKYKKIATFFIFFTMLFSGGLIPTYIWITRYLHLGDTIWVYILPCLVNAFHVIVIRSFFQGLPQALMESAKIDGASELQTFFKIVMPLSKPVIATISLLTLLSRWNDWNTALIYIKSSNLYSLQYLLQKILREAEFVKNMAESSPVAGVDLDLSNLPSVTIRFAMCMVAAGPMLIIFPFFQKYFAKGLTVGAVKG